MSLILAGSLGEEESSNGECIILVLVEVRGGECSVKEESDVAD